MFDYLCYLLGRAVFKLFLNAWQDEASWQHSSFELLGVLVLALVIALPLLFIALLGYLAGS